LEDPRGAAGGTGDCDAQINQTRRELQLPERLYYHPRINVVSLQSRRIVVATLEFAGIKEWYLLLWQADQVSPAARQVARLQTSLLLR
jgi:hypothetical protein